MVILVTGANSQLGLCLKDLYDNSYEYLLDTWEFCSHEELDITNVDSIKTAFNKYKPDVVVNCAAYTNVEKAEDEFVKCHKINCIGIENLVDECQNHDAFFISISSDYVYDSDIANGPLKESDNLNPLSKYAITKYLGELICEKEKGTMIIRTSWLYSQYGTNFVKTMAKLMKKGNEIRVVNDQIGRPTNANDLAEFIMFSIIVNRHFSIDEKCKIYNFQNSGEPCSWYDFTCEIATILNIKSCIIPVKSYEFKCKAKRPSYSVMNIDKASEIMQIPFWKTSLKLFLDNHKDIILKV